MEEYYVMNEKKIKKKEEVTWKLSKARAGILSSNSCIMSHGPSPTPTNTIDKGSALQHKRKKEETDYITPLQT